MGFHLLQTKDLIKLLTEIYKDLHAPQLHDFSLFSFIARSSHIASVPLIEPIKYRLFSDPDVVDGPQGQAAIILGGSVMTHTK